MRRQHSRHSPNTPPRRSGVLSMELLLTLPIFAVLLFGLFEYSLLFAARGDVVAACRAGARRAAVRGANLEDIDAEVRASLPVRLATHCEIEAELGDNPGDPVIVAVRAPMSAASPDLLWPIGFGLRDREFYCQTRMVRE